MFARHVVLAAVILLFLVSNWLLAGIGTINGKEGRLWTEGRLTVLTGTIHRVQEAKEITKYYNAEFVPTSTLAGSFDPSLHVTLPVDFYAGRYGTKIGRVPPEGSVVMAVVELYEPKDAPQTLHGFIVSDNCTFMPENSALVVIKGMDDPRVAETLKKIQEARAHPNPNPYGESELRPPTTRPGQ